MGHLTVEKDVNGIEGLCIITPYIYEDERGFFYESYSQRDMLNAGIDIKFVQDNQSMSKKGVLRGLHFQKQHPQTKLVRVIRGEVFDVVVDIRKESKTYGRWHGIRLSEYNRRQLLIPAGMAHGFLALSDMVECCYKCDDLYCPGDEGGIAWNDPNIGISWPGVEGVYRGSAAADGYTFEKAPLIVSDKDAGWDILK